MLEFVVPKGSLVAGGRNERGARPRDTTPGLGIPRRAEGYHAEPRDTTPAQGYHAGLVYL